MAAQGRGPILATAESNVAVDNLLEGLLESGVNAVRIGQPVKVRASLREATLDARLEHHPLQEDLAALREKHDTLKRGLSGLRGKERGLAHKDLSMQRREMQRLERQMVDGLLDGAEVVCATTVGSGHRILGSRRFPIVLVDEATQASEPSSLVPIVRGCRHLVLVGDHRPLPPTVLSDRATEGGLGRSLFERLIDLGLPTHMLTTQYRMHPSIREFPALVSTRTDLRTAAQGQSDHLLRASSGRIGTVQSPSFRWTARRNWTRKALRRPTAIRRRRRSASFATFSQQATSKVMTLAS